MLLSLYFQLKQVHYYYTFKIMVLMQRPRLLGPKLREVYSIGTPTKNGDYEGR